MLLWWGQWEGFESMHFKYVQTVTKSESLSLLCLASHLHYPPRILEIPIALHSNKNNSQVIEIPA